MQKGGEHRHAVGLKKQVTGSPKASKPRASRRARHCITETSETNVVRATVRCKHWIGDDPAVPPSADEIRPKRCPACGVAAAPVGGPVKLHAHSKHRMRGIRGVVEPAEAGDLGEDGGLEVVDTRIAIRRYRCIECETTCTVLPAEVRVHAEILRTTVALALAVWVLHPDRPSAEKVRRWMFPDRRCVVGDWAQLRDWAVDGVELVAPEDLLTAGASPKVRAGETVQICRARAPPEMRDKPPWARAQRGARRPH